MHRVLCILFFCFKGCLLAQDNSSDFKKRIVIKDLSDPWEITYGPENHLWVTESKRYLVKKINPETGESKLLLDLSKEKNFSGEDHPWPQGGLMGLALHPKFHKDKKYVYLCYVFRFDALNDLGGATYTGKLVRYRYDKQSEQLQNPIILCDTLPQSNDHNSGRLAVGRVAGKPYLFLTVGDGGAGQYSNAGAVNYAQDKTHYAGKVLRFNLEPDEDEDRYNRWIPNDNPFHRPDKQNAVWSYGHRNAQGLAYAEINGLELLFSTEHGPYGDDELNRIEKGKNYGHPLIIGKNDGNYTGFAGAVSDNEKLPLPWRTTLPTIDENRSARLLGDTFREPITVFHSLSAELLATVFNESVHDAPYVPETPAVAPSSLAIYTAEAIPGWKNSLLVPSLKEGKLIRLKLGTNFEVLQEQIDYFKADARYRDVAISNNGKKIYLATDKTEASSNPSKNIQQNLVCKGCIIEYSYAGNE